MKQLLCVLFCLITSRALAGWIPPENPDPQLIFKEAKEDASAQRYEDALAKHVWFHQNALSYRQSLYGVRLSYALNAWARLGEAYPPALEKLKSIRDDAEQKIRENKGTHGLFHDFVAINKVLSEETKTKDLFIWLDVNNPDMAKKIFDLAKPALINAKEFKLCGNYIEADESFQTAMKLYQTNMRLSRDPKFGDELQKFGEKKFSNDTATLVSLLILSERSEDAERIINEALKEWDNPQFKEELEKAKSGCVPVPWP
jgi:tetratricopeptide (TPR) repeat protein